MKTATNSRNQSTVINKFAYVAFFLLGVFYLIKKDFSQASIYWGLGLAFDPFNQEVPFPKRPFYQQAWLIIHLSITLALIVLMFVTK